VSALIRLVGLGLAVAAIGFGVAGCGDSIKHKVSDAKTTYNDAKTTYNAAKDVVNDATVKGSAESSYFKASNLGNALDKIKAKAGDDAIEVDIYPGYVQADVSTGSETEGKRYHVNKDGTLAEAKLTLTSVAGGKLADNIFPIADVDPGTVESTINAVAKKEGTTVDSVSYVLIKMSLVNGKPEMNIYVKGGAFYTANLDGSGLKNPVGDATKAVSKAKATGDCIQKAGTDVAKMAACNK
jgi:hypothetical protein